MRGLALAFAFAAPAVTLGGALLWAAGSGPHQVMRGPLLVQGAAFGLVLVAVSAAAFVRYRTPKVSGFEAFLLRAGRHAVIRALVRVRRRELPDADDGAETEPYLFDAVLWGLVPPMLAGLALAIAWRGRR